MSKQTFLVIRVQNHIGFIKHHLSKRNITELYNDFLIMDQIIPKLPKNTLLELLQVLKPLNDFMNITPILPPMTIYPLLEILAKAPI